MNNQTEEHNMGSTLWQSQALDAPRISLGFVRHQAERLNADLRHELLGAYLGIIISMVALCWSFVALPPGVNQAMAWVIRLAVLLAIPASLYSVFQIRRRNNKLSVAAGAQVVPSLDAYREELKSRQNFYASALGWSLLPIMPTVLVILIGEFIFDQRLNAGIRFAVFVFFMIFAFLLGGKYYRYKINKLRRELDALATLEDK